MRVGQRLFLAVIPAILGLLTVAALAYFGEYAHEAPEWLVLLAVIASVTSAILAWRNTRYVASRIEQLAMRRGLQLDASEPLRRASALLGPGAIASPSPNETVDELDRIEHLVERLSDALASARSAQDEARISFRQRQREYATLVRAAVDRSLRQLDEVRLPLHILLDNHFGELNENQEEMLGAARAATESVDIGLLRLRDVLRLDLDEVAMRADRIRVGDLLSSVLPSLQMEGASRDVAVVHEIAVPLPTIDGDRVWLQDALSQLLHDALSRTPDGTALALHAEEREGAIRITVSGAVGEPPAEQAAFARRVVEACHGQLVAADGSLRVVLRPSAAS